MSIAPLFVAIQNKTQPSYAQIQDEYFTLTSLATSFYIGRIAILKRNNATNFRDSQVWNSKKIPMFSKIYDKENKI